MSTPYIIIGLTIVLALAFDFINGFHDTANAIATAVSTKALSPRRAIISASAMNFIGAITFTGVAKTITKDIVNLNATPNGAVVILVIFGASKFGLPVSATHVISSAIMGVSTSYRVKAIKWNTGKRMIITWFITLPISAALAAVVYMLMNMFL